MNEFAFVPCCSPTCPGPCAEHAEPHEKPGQSIALFVRAMQLAPGPPPGPGCAPQYVPVQASIAPTVRLPDGTTTTVATVTYQGNGWHRADFGPIPMNEPSGRAYVRWQATGVAPSANGLLETTFWVDRLDY